MIPYNEYKSRSKNYDFFTQKCSSSSGNCSFYDTMWIKPRYPFIKKQMNSFNELIGKKNNKILIDKNL